MLKTRKDWFAIALSPRAPYTFPMIKKLYWAFRLIGYIACLGGIFFYLAHQADAGDEMRNLGLGIVGIGFFAFFASYGLRAWLRYAPKKRPKELPPSA